MKLLIVDQDGVGLSFALRASQAGHEVRWFIKPRKSISPDIGTGFKGITKVDNWVANAKWADLIMCTSNDDYIEKLDQFRKAGKKVFAPPPSTVKLEVSRATGMKVLEKAGIECAPYKTFKNMAEAEKHVVKSDERFVFKTMGDNEDKSLTYVSKSPSDMVAWMRRTPPPKGEVMLQTFISGIEMGVSRFMGSKGWVGQWNESFEHKKLMSGNHGPNTGEMGTVAYFTPYSKLGDDTLDKLGDTLMGMGHIGDTALGFIIDDKGKPWPTEWTCRLGWPIANMMLGATSGDPVQWMADAIDGKDSTSFIEDIGVCVVLAQPDFPYGNCGHDETCDTPIFGVSKGNNRHVHPQAVKMAPVPVVKDNRVEDKPMWVSAGDYLAVVTGFGKSVSQASRRAYKTVGQIQISNCIVRDDIGECLKQSLPKLHDMGYADHCEY